ncbi:MAG: RNA methyltransferase [Lewinellaceae bacterium]|nr:RNA methyltransferase [Saprospiraceae bacterium]MCB9339901.1 RNA methyltransferase [Lewinellaceae bacterium]
MRKLTTEELGRLSPDEFSQLAKTPLVLVLDNVRSALNVGSAFRTADAFALGKIYLCGITAAPPHREILKTALGATETVPWEYFPSTLDALARLKGEGYEILAIEQAAGSIFLHNFEISSKAKYALVFGNEVEGVGQEVMEMVDRTLEIQQFGTKHSINVAVSIGIVVWDLFKKLKFGLVDE